MSQLAWLTGHYIHSQLFRNGHIHNAGQHMGPKRQRPSGQHPQTNLPSLPELLLGSGGVQCVLQLRLQSLQLLAEVPLELLGLVPGHLLRLQVLLQLCQLGLQLTHLLQRVVLLSCFLITSNADTQSTILIKTAALTKL